MLIRNFNLTKKNDHKWNLSIPKYNFNCHSFLKFNNVNIYEYLKIFFCIIKLIIGIIFLSLNTYN